MAPVAIQAGELASFRLDKFLNICHNKCLRRKSHRVSRVVLPEETEKLREQVRKLVHGLEQARKQIGQQEKDIQKLEKN